MVNESNPSRAQLWLSTGMAIFARTILITFLLPMTKTPRQVVLQVEGKKGLDVIKKRLALRGPVAIYDGALAFAGGSFMGHYPWRVLGGSRTDCLPFLFCRKSVVHLSSTVSLETSRDPRSCLLLHALQFACLTSPIPDPVLPAKACLVYA